MSRPFIDGAGNQGSWKTTQSGSDDVIHHIAEGPALSSIDTKLSGLAAVQVAVQALAALIESGRLKVEAQGITVEGGDFSIDNAALASAINTALRGSALPVSSSLPSGAASAANQTTALTALSAIQAAVQTLDNAISGNEMQVDIVSSALPSGAATSALQSTANTALSAIQSSVAGTLNVRDTDLVPLTSLVSGVVTNTDGASVAVIAAQGSGVRTYLTDATITNSSANDVMAEIKDGATTRWRALIPAGGGVSHRFASPLVGTANTAWNIDAAAATTSIYASFSGFKV